MTARMRTRTGVVIACTEQPENRLEYPPRSNMLHAAGNIIIEPDNPTARQRA
jgi:hypothetical protein